MRYLSIVFIVFISLKIEAQELFVVTEPASNIPAGSIGARVNQSLLKNQIEGGDIYSFAPEISWGVSKNLMIRASVYLNNSNNTLDYKGSGVYAKYRFLSVDDLQSHSRMAIYARYSWNNSPINQEAIDVMGMNTGYETGLVATQLINKVALSSSVSYSQTFKNASHPFPENQGKNGINYAFSVGRLMYPKKYTSFKQTNINTMLEFVGQTILANGKSSLDIVPSIQFIINSQARVDLAYKKELYNAMSRLASDGFFLKLEYTFFNVSK